MGQQVRVARDIMFIGDGNNNPNIEGNLNPDKVMVSYQFTDLATAAAAAATATSIAAAVPAAAPAGGTGVAAGGWDTAANRDLAITTINDLRTHAIEMDLDYEALLADVADLRAKYVKEYTFFLDTNSTITQGSGGIVLTTVATDTKTATATSGGVWWYPAKNCIVEMKFRIDVITNVAIFAGFSDAASEATSLLPFGLVTATLTDTATDAAGFLLDTRQTLAYFNVVNTKNGTEAFTQLDSTRVPVAATDLVLRTAIDTSGNARFYWNGIEVSYKANAVSTTVPLIPFFGIRNNTATAHVATLRYVRCWQDS